MKTTLSLVGLLCLAVASAIAQTTPPISILGRNINGAIDSMLLVRTTVADGRLELPIIGFNWSGANNRMTDDMHFNTWHYKATFHEVPDTTVVGWQNTWAPLHSYHHVQTLRPGMQLIVDPMFEMPTDSNTTFYQLSYPWFDRIRVLMSGASRLPLHFSHGFPNALIEGMGVRYHPELDVGPRRLGIRRADGHAGG